MLNHRLARPERSRYCGHSSLSYREQSVYYPLARYERHFGNQLFSVRSSASYGPLLHHRKLSEAAVRHLDLAYRFIYRKLSVFDGFHHAGYAERHHYSVLHHYGLLHRADYVAGLYLFTRFYGRDELPLLRPRKGRNLYSSCYVRSRGLIHGLERPLNTVVHGLYKSRSQLYRKRGSCTYNGYTRADSGRLFVYLYRGLVASHLYYFTYQSLISYMNHVEHVCLFHSRGHYQRS